MKKLSVLMIAMMALMAIGASAVLIETPAAGATDVCGATYNFSAVVKTAASAENVTFYWNNSGTLVALCSLDNTTVAGGASFSCLGDTTGVTDGAINVVARVFNESPSEVEINVSAITEFDNTGPTLTFDGINTPDNSKVDEVTDFNISFTTDEAMQGTPYVSIGTKIFNLKNTSMLAWYYNFDEYDLPDGTYKYSIIGGEDNTSCTNSAGNDLTRYVSFGKASSAKAGTLAALEAQQQGQTAAQKLTSNRVVLAVVAVLAYLLFFHNKRGKKR